jgi:hypothetical protein
MRCSVSAAPIHNETGPTMAYPSWLFTFLLGKWM